MPYFDPVSNDLYFASKGHNSMGGFDVFKSHYDQERDSWSDPIPWVFPSIRLKMNTWSCLDRTWAHFC